VHGLEPTGAGGQPDAVGESAERERGGKRVERGAQPGLPVVAGCWQKQQRHDRQRYGDEVSDVAPGLGSQQVFVQQRRGRHHQPAGLGDGGEP
jgi:hypothetical protein